jgi:hypothetical protein
MHIFTEFQSPTFTNFLTLLHKLKNTPQIAQATCICLSCWCLILREDQQHAGHQLTGSFAQMVQATDKQLQTMC